MSTPPPSDFDEERHRRLLKMFISVYGYRFGSLWWVLNELWAEADIGFKPSKKKSTMHPGVACRIGDAISPYDEFPLLFGTSKRSRPSVVAHDLSDEKGDKHKTYFGTLLEPALFHFEEFMSFKNGPRARIERNSHKPDMDDIEAHSLRDFMEKATGHKGEN